MLLPNTKTRLMKFSRVVALAGMFLVAMITILGKGGDGGPGGGDDPENFAGTWTTSTTITADTCDLPPGEADLGTLMISQSGANVTILDSDGESYSGTVSGDTMTFSGSSTDGNEQISISGTATINGDSMSGTATANISVSGEGSCEVTVSFTATRISGGTAEGLWLGTTTDSRELAGVVLDDGEYWFVVSQEMNADVIGGILQGTGTSDNGSFMSSNGKLFDVDGGISDVTLSATYVEKQSLNGTVSDSMESVMFSAAYSPLYDMMPSLGIIAGSYVGTAAGGSGREGASISISSTGEISGSSDSDCAFTGTASVHSSGNLYDISITFMGSPCPQGTDTLTGVAFYDPSDDTLIAATLNASRTDGLVYIGVKLVPL